MIVVKVRVKKDSKTHSDELYLDEDYNICKENEDFKNKVARVIREASFITPEDMINPKPEYDVKISIRFDW